MVGGGAVAYLSTHHCVASTSEGEGSDELSSGDLMATYLLLQLIRLGIPATYLGTFGTWVPIQLLVLCATLRGGSYPIGQGRAFRAKRRPCAI